MALKIIPILKLCPITSLLIIINCLIFLLMVVSGISPFSPTSEQLLLWGANFAPITLNGEAWRLISSMFLHIGIIHLLMNMWALFLFGSYAERYYGKGYFLVLYFLGGIFASLASAYLNLQHSLAVVQGVESQLPAISAGASGSIMAIGGSLLVAAYLPKQQLSPQFLLNKNALMMIAGINIAFGFIVQGIDNAAHAGGALGGISIALLYKLTEKFSAIPRKMISSIFILLLLALAWYVLLTMHQQATILLTSHA